jgi:hypothetical protein
VRPSRFYGVRITTGAYQDLLCTPMRRNIPKKYPSPKSDALGKTLYGEKKGKLLFFNQVKEEKIIRTWKKDEILKIKGR